MAQMKPIDKLTLKEMIENIHIYYGLSDGLIELPVPDSIKIKRKKLPIPKDVNEFSSSICYGQRIFLGQKEDNDFGLIVRMIDGYYYPLATKNNWDADKALLFGKYVLTLHVDKLYPLAMHLVTLLSKLAEQEQKLLHREPSKIELAAGIENLNKFSDLTSLDFLRDAMKCTVPEVLLTPYNECLVRFMIAHETNLFNERYMELLREDAKSRRK